MKKEPEIKSTANTAQETSVETTMTPIKNRSAQTLWMVQTAILSAIIIIMSFTPLGFLQVGTISITFLMIPVVIGAVIVGPACGLTLGAVFGLTSFARAFGLEPFGALLLGINPFLTFVMCFVPRVLMGYFVGLIFRALSKIDKTKLISFAAASLSGALLNTVLYVSAMVLFFGDFITTTFKDVGSNIPAILVALVLVNAVVEAAVCMVAGGAITKALSVTMKKAA
jgi:uncharacterized membrane protein